jgi:hypothetical protein
MEEEVRQCMEHDDTAAMQAADTENFKIVKNCF